VPPCRCAAAVGGLAAEVAAAERLASLGRVAAGVAHEIRNPIAAMRLRAENALAGDDARRRKALEDMLGLIGRLDGLIGELLAMTQRREPRPGMRRSTHFGWGRVAPHREQAARCDIDILIEDKVARGFFDPEMIGRIIGNWLINAVRHTPPGGRIQLEATRWEDGLSFSVADTGPGIPPDLRDNLFDPFVTGRADGPGSVLQSRVNSRTRMAVS
jgi:signal transduction histidine kinase